FMGPEIFHCHGYSKERLTSWFLHFKKRIPSEDQWRSEAYDIAILNVEVPNLVSLVTSNKSDVFLYNLPYGNPLLWRAVTAVKEDWEKTQSKYGSEDNPWGWAKVRTMNLTEK